MDKSKNEDIENLESSEEVKEDLSDEDSSYIEETKKEEAPAINKINLQITPTQEEQDFGIKIKGK